MIQDHQDLPHYEEGEAPVEFASTVEEHYHQVFISSEILHWNSSGNKNNGFKSVGHQPWQCLRFLAVTYINLETQIKTLKNIVDEKQVGIKEAIKIISLLNASRKLLVSEVLILLVHTTNAVRERSRSALWRV